MSVTKRIGAFLLAKWGWTIQGPVPWDVPKCVVVVYPHTSNWDFPVGILFNMKTGLDINWVGKHTLFKPPLGGLMKRIGGRPVVRTGNTKFVDAVAEVFKREKEFRLCVTPEGTRTRPDELKSGFHHIARAAGVPIVFVAFDWGTKVMRWQEPFWPDEDYTRTLAAFHDAFRGSTGYHPQDAYNIPEPE